MWRAGESILLTLWIGTLWCIGFLVAPILFSVIDDRALAGTLAGKLFSVGAVTGLIAGSVWLALRRLRGGSLTDGPALLAFTTLALLALGEGLVQPLASAARAAGGTDFARWHGLASLLWLGACVAGLALVVTQGHLMRGVSGSGR